MGSEGHSFFKNLANTGQSVSAASHAFLSVATVVMAVVVVTAVVEVAVVTVVVVALVALVVIALVEGVMVVVAMAVVVMAAVVEVEVVTALIVAKMPSQTKPDGHATHRSRTTYCCESHCSIRACSWLSNREAGSMI